MSVRRPPPSTAEELTAGPLLARNTLLNLLGQGLPLVVAVAAIPILIQGIGVDRFGLLALAWLVIGYFSLFDLGIGRALTQFVSERIGHGRDDEVAPVAWTGLALMTALGVAAWAALHLLAPILVTRVLNVPVGLQAEAVGAFRILALAVPFVVSAAGLRGLLEAVQRFGLVNAVRIPLGTLTFLAPLAVLPLSTDLRAVVAALAAIRVLAWGAYGLLLLRAMPSLRRKIGTEVGQILSLVRFGSWITVSNVVSPLMVHLDRVVIGAVLSMAAVAYYATPFEVVTRLWIVPVAVMGVLFPAFATSYAADRTRAAWLFDQATRGILLLLLPVVLLVVGVSGPALELWVGADFAREGAVVARWLALGVFVNSLAQVPYALLQAMGRPDLTAKLHLAEAPFYFFLLWGLLAVVGLPGAAIAWTVRVIVDAILLFAFTAYLVPGCRQGALRVAGWALPGVALIGLAALPVEGAPARAALLGALLLAFLAGAWFFVLERAHRVRVLSYVRPGRKAVVLVGAAGCLAGAAQPAGSQAPSAEATQEPVISTLGLRGEEARYLRMLQMQGKVPAHAWGIRSFGPRERDRLAPAAESLHPWRGRVGSRIAVDGRHVRVEVQPVGVRTFYESAFPLNWQDGPVWTGRGLSGELTLGGEVRAGPLVVRLAPVFWTAQNRAFPLMERSESSPLPLADPRWPRHIDFPQRLSDGSLTEMNLGESELRLDLLGLATGISTAPIGWGPGEVFSLVMSGRGTGFPHGFLGTSRPLDLRVLRLHFRGAWGELAQSDQTPWEGLQARRFASSAVVSVTPAPLPELELGMGRFFHIPWREGGPTLDDALRPFETVLKEDLLIDSEGRDITANQLSSGWVRWVFPEAGLELYGEYARNDHPWDFRDLVVEPDHNAAWLLGSAWARDAEGRTWVFRAETANARINHLAGVRRQRMFFRHGSVRHGHTHRGRILGTPAIYGGGGSYLGVDVYEERGRLGARWRRELRNDQWTPPGGLDDPSRAHDVIHALTLDGVWFRNRIEWSGELTGAFNLNRYFQDDVFNLRLVIGGRARF